MRQKETIYKAYCDACHDEISGKIYFEKDAKDKPEDFCKACYIRLYGSKWEYLWFKIHIWIYVLGALLVSALVNYMWGPGVFWINLIVIVCIWLVFYELFKHEEQSTRERQDEEYEEKQT